MTINQIEIYHWAQVDITYALSQKNCNGSRTSKYYHILNIPIPKDADKKLKKVKRENHKREKPNLSPLSEYATEQAMQYHYNQGGPENQQ